jgi:small subunit ribosomal protein S21
MAIEIRVFNNNVEKAIRVLKKKMLKDGVMKELKQRRYYEKPSEKKLRLQKENIRRWRKAQKRRMERE